MKRLRVVIADDSDFFRDALRGALEAGDDIEVVAEAENGLQALAAVKQHKPDLLTLDLQMPRLDGLSVIEELMSDWPLPILVVSARPQRGAGGVLFEATRLGALDVIEKGGWGDTAAQAARLREHVQLLAKLPVVRRSRSERPGAVPGSPHAETQPQSQALSRQKLPTVLLIGASAGGPAALASVLSALPARFPVPVGVVQHLSSGFADSFASFLREHTSLKVVSVSGPTPFVPGTVALPVDDLHLVTSTFGWDVSGRSEVNGHRPSIDVLFDSAARLHGAKVCASVLTGMGADGARGLLAIRQAGGLTFAQDEESSAVYGIPRAAAALGAAGRILPLRELGPLFAKAFSG